MQGIYFKFTIMKKILFQLFFLIVATGTFAQDARLSQIWSMPTMMNPSFSGKFDGSYRLGAGNSSQKSKLGAVNHQFGFVDSRFEGRATGFDRYFGLGVSYYQYGNGATPINARFVALTGAHHFNLSKDGVHSMGVGTQLAFASASASEKNGLYDKEINGGGFRWNDFNPNGTRSNVSNYIDWNSGLYYRYKGQDLNIELGAAGYHYLHPKNSLITYDAEHRLRGRIVFHSKIDININTTKILTFQNIFWTEGLYWVSRSIDKYNLVSNWGGLELSKAVPSDKIYINYGMYTRSFKTIMPYASFISRNGFNLRASYELPFNATRFDAYTAKRFEITLHYTVGGSNSNRTAKTPSSVPSRKNVIPQNIIPNSPPLNTTGIPNNSVVRNQGNTQGNIGFQQPQNLDRDNDGLSDNIDRCPDQAGPVSNQGCPLPDRDSDGVPDVSDNCPDNAGPLTNGGCPDNNVVKSQGMVNIPAPQNLDRDNDGLTDNVDRCPDQAGPISNQGCPLSDRDGDGVPDISDNCPDKAGSPSNKGCPEIPKKPQNLDTDNDGLTDNVDKCPNQAGPITNQGCPLSDKDKDGIPDITDKCPDKPGTAENEGCPENLYKNQEKIAAAKMTSDRDKDGILDVNDLCPDQAGPIANQGCPLSDTDGDGVPDIADKCPDVSGSPTNGGCPEIVIKTDTTKKDSANQIAVDTLKFNIYFDLDKYSLSQNSFDVLGKIIQEMKQDAKYKCVLVGHSDTEGSAEYNLTLAKNRTGVAKSYIMSYGIGDARIVSKYVGETEPLPVASKDLGWMNRRVAIYLYKTK